MTARCPDCGCGRTFCIGLKAYQTAIDDAVEVSIMLCDCCGHEWEQ